jgi:predicted RNA binding protein YcfA (HicA-like mRNA interferase family)
MKLPRGLSSERLIRALEHLGYKVVRQKGSHIRLRHEGPPVHMITVPQHNPLKAGTLHGILTEVEPNEIANHRGSCEIAVTRRLPMEPPPSKSHYDRSHRHST